MKSREELMQWASQFEDGPQRMEALLNMRCKRREEGDYEEKNERVE